MLYGLLSPARDARHRAENGFSARVNGRERGLLAVALEDLVAGGADLGTMFLETRQDGEIALVDHRTAELLHVAGAGLLFLRRSAALLLGEGSGRSRERQQSECKEKFTHRFPSFRQQESCSPICAGTDFVWMAGAPRNAATNGRQAWQMRPNLRQHLRRPKHLK